ncbi:hypothetical protein B0H11DRAFT_1387741 [Mycena galericulata]|nr:hypothetical protein B0H11DRAFT_1387741 [Mycena galericulata]
MSTGQGKNGGAVGTGKSKVGTPSTSATGSQRVAPLTRSGGSTTIPTATGSHKSVPSTPRNALPTGAIVGIVIGVCSIFSLGILLLWLRRRRRRHRHRQVFVSPIPILSPAIETSARSAGSTCKMSYAPPRRRWSIPRMWRGMRIAHVRRVDRFQRAKEGFCASCRLAVRQLLDLDQLTTTRPSGRGTRC